MTSSSVVSSSTSTALRPISSALFRRALGARGGAALRPVPFGRRVVSGLTPAAGRFGALAALLPPAFGLAVRILFLADMRRRLTTWPVLERERREEL